MTVIGPVSVAVGPERSASEPMRTAPSVPAARTMAGALSAASVVAPDIIALRRESGIGFPVASRTKLVIFTPPSVGSCSEPVNEPARERPLMSNRVSLVRFRDLEPSWDVPRAKCPFGKVLSHLNHL